MSTPHLRARLLELLRLKELPRAGWVRAGVERPESVADHSWGLSLLVLQLCPEGLSLERCLSIAAVHDLPEILAGDITPSDGISPSEKRSRESAAAEQLFRGDSAHMLPLWREYDAGDTPEARFVRACDKLEMALQAAVYEATSDLDLSEFIESALSRLEEGSLRELAQK